MENLMEQWEIIKNYTLEHKTLILNAYLDTGIALILVSWVLICIYIVYIWRQNHVLRGSWKNAEVKK